MIWALDQNIYDMYESKLQRRARLHAKITYQKIVTAQRCGTAIYGILLDNTLGLKVRYDLKSGSAVYRYLYGKHWMTSEEFVERGTWLREP